MYRTFVKSTEQAVVHLLLYCAHKDQKFLQLEYVALGNVIKQLNADKHIDLTREIENFYTYQSQINDENLYLGYLVQKIGSTHRLSLYWHCLQLVHANDSLALQEETLLAKIAKLLYINSAATYTLHSLVQQNNALRREQCF